MRKMRCDVPVIPGELATDPEAQERVRRGVAMFAMPKPRGVNGIQTQFKPGDIVTWLPRKARRGCFGLPIAYQPVDVEILLGPRANGEYRVRVVEPAIRRVLSRPFYEIDGQSLVEK